MITFNGFYHLLAEEQQLRPWLGTIPQLLESWHERQHGLFHRWEKALLKLPEHLDSQVDFSQQVHSFHDAIDGDERKKIEALLRFFHPWRKGPYHVQGIHVDSEWRSDFKWDRLLPHISSLDNRRVLDIGCGNGYHMWRMLGAGARYVIGVDPSDLFLVQFEAIRRLCNSEPRLHLLPLGMEQLPASQAFDTVFCMGVLYHRKSPIEAMEQLFEQLRSGGELVLETLVVDGDVHQVLVPGERYAKMRNVWFIPSVAALCHWLERVGFCNVRCVDVNQTSIEEQRATDWMTNESLPEFLHPADNNLTVEGYPAPKRAIIIANRP